MKVIDLLNKIANGEIPKTIVYDERYFTYDDKRENYFTYDDSEIDWKYTVMEYINDKIEIIEETPTKEPKGIPKKLEILPNNEQYSNKVLYGKINEIIDTLEMLNDKIK